MIMTIASKARTGIAALLCAVLALSLCPLAPAAAYGAEAPAYQAASIATADQAPLAYKATSVSKAYGAKFTNKLTVATDGAVRYSSSNKRIATVDAKGRVTAKGVGTVTIKATSAKTASWAAGTASYRLTVTPKAVKLRSLAAAGKGFKATWAKGSKACTNGYQVRYSKYRDMSAAKTVKAAGAGKASAALRKLSGSNNCFAQVRAYAKGKDGKVYYGAWSAKKQVIGALGSGDKVLDANVKALIKRFGTGDGALKKAFSYVTNLKYKSASTSLKGNWSVAAAKRMYKAKAGNCYEKAALLGWVAKGLGYNAKPVAGKLVNVKTDGSVTQNPHGWVEIKHNGKVSYCDPDTTKTLSDMGASQIRGYSTYLFMVGNGKPYTYKK